MPDNDPTPDPDPDAKPDDKPDLSAEVDKWKSLARKHELQAKANAEAAKRLAQLEDEGKSEIEKAAAKVAEAEKRATDAEARADRLEVVIAKALDEDQARRVTTAAKRLVGASRDELEADADELLASFATPNGDGDKPTPPGKPSEDLKGGGDPSAAPSPDIRKIVDEIPRGGF